MLHRFPLCSLALLSVPMFGAAVPGGGARGQGTEGLVHFDRDVRPLLAEYCFGCHGPDEATRVGEVRLDEREQVFADLGGYRLVTPHELEQSELWLRISESDPDLRMPPPEEPSLAPEDLAVFRRWIEQGAPWQQLWSLSPPVRPEVPEVVGKDWPRGPIDAFVLRELEEEGLLPSPDAEPSVLIRRLGLDLLGLPPTPVELESFMAAPENGRVEALVDRWLDSPHYGERMAMFWLDLVRYADTTGFHGDNHRSVWPYRDYVIEAFNRNLPYDRFSIEQIAGDLLETEDRSALVASGFNRLNMTTQEAGAQEAEYLAKYAADRVRTTATIWLGLTVGCAECHDHKFDPISTRDFYRFSAFFADIQEQGVGVPTPTLLPNADQKHKLDRAEAFLIEQEQILSRSTPALEEEQRVWERSVRAEIAAGSLPWGSLSPVAAASEEGADLSVQDDLSILASGTNPSADIYSTRYSFPEGELRSLRLELLEHPSHRQRLGRGRDGSVVITHVELWVQDLEGEPERVAWRDAEGTSFDEQSPVAHLIDDDPSSGWRVETDRGAGPVAAILRPSERLEGRPGRQLVLILKMESAHEFGTIGNYRLSMSSDPCAGAGAAMLPDFVRRIMLSGFSDRDEEQVNRLAAYFRGVASSLDPVRELRSSVERTRQIILRTVPTSLVTQSGPARTIRVLPRGNWTDQSGEVVEAGIPSVFGALAPEGKSRNRRDLARWIVSRDNPLAARVFVNHVWRLFFGSGLVASVDDFGNQGERPRHAALLDWLAVEFMESGWDVKALVREILTSRTYLQTSVFTPMLLERDPDNRLLARQSSYRVDAEVVRDLALAASGLLSRRIGGPSVKPRQPDGYWDDMNFPSRTWKTSRGEGLVRRGLYTFWCRTFLHPELGIFDAPTREGCTAQRSRSNTPLQALVLLNDPTFVAAARALAQGAREKASGGDEVAGLSWAFHRVLSRAPGAEETAILSDLYRRHLRHYGSHSAEARALLGIDPETKQASLPNVDADLAAWTSTMRTLLCLHETITRN